MIDLSSLGIKIW